MAKRRTRKDKGLGDTVERVTKATGIDKVVKWVAGEDCGCQERKEKLNRIFRYAQPKCLLEAEYGFLGGFLKGYKSTVSHDDQVRLVNIYNRVFDDSRKVTNCGPCVGQLIEDLKKVYDEYNG